MRKRFWVAMLAVTMVVLALCFKNASATSPNIVLSQIQLGNALSASNEFVELYNNGATDTEITNWCLYYASASSTQIGSKLGCFTPESDSLHLYLPSRTFSFAISTILSGGQPTLGSDLKFSATLSGTAGHVRVIDSGGNEIDKVGWGSTAMSPETLYVPTAPVGKVLGRKVSSVPTILQDTDNNSLDFELVAPRTSYAYGSIYEVQDLCKNIDGIQQLIPPTYSVDDANNCLPPPVDVCTNIDGLQTTVPLGYGLDEAGLCRIDVCQNITGLQLTVPAGKEFDQNNNCVDHDFCVNLSGIQAAIPSGYTVNIGGSCLLDLSPLKINELLPNATGTDDGNEFIELYNPNNVAIDLSSYRAQVGIDTSKVYAFPAGSVIPATGYISFSNDDIAFTLVNSSSQVSVVSADNQLIDQSLTYSNPSEGMSWALIDGVWQYTNQPTPGSANLASLIEQDANALEVATGLLPCAVNQYRNPDTNRCRLLVTVASTLTPCKDGQYRSETTNRCRSIADDASILTPCDANQERNPDTNRCRLTTAGSSDLAPCSTGQERNPDTNRCRNVAGSVPEAAFAVEPVADSANGVIGWWVAAGVGLIALAYAAWEWHEELFQKFRKFGAFFHLRK